MLLGGASQAPVVSLDAFAMPLWSGTYLSGSQAVTVHSSVMVPLRLRPLLTLHVTPHVHSSEVGQVWAAAGFCRVALCCEVSASSCERPVSAAGWLQVRSGGRGHPPLLSGPRCQAPSPSISWEVEEEDRVSLSDH